jgi:hypothetical protein
VDKVEILEKERETNMNLQECLISFKEELSNEKDKVARLELELSKK